DDAVVVAVAHHLHLEFLPPDHRFLDEQLVGGGSVEPALADGDELLHVVGDAAAGAAERERGPDDRGEPHHRLHLQRLHQRMRELGARALQADLRHRVLELLAVLGLVDRLLLRADHLDAEAVEHAFACEVERAVERGLPAHRGQERIRALLLDDARDHLPGDRLDVGDIGHLRVGHDRGGVGVHQDHAVALVAQGLARLRAGVVELAALADHDRAGADDEDGFEVGALGHYFLCSIIFTNLSNSTCISCGPGLASGWPWKLYAGLSVSSMPCSEPSNSERCVGRTFAGSVFSSTWKPWFWLVMKTRPVSRSCTGWFAP